MHVSVRGGSSSSSQPARNAAQCGARAHVHSWMQVRTWLCGSAAAAATHRELPCSCSCCCLPAKQQQQQQRQQQQQQQQQMQMQMQRRKQQPGPSGRSSKRSSPRPSTAPPSRCQSTPSTTCPTWRGSPRAPPTLWRTLGLTISTYSTTRCDFKPCTQSTPARARTRSVLRQGCCCIYTLPSQLCGHTLHTTACCHPRTCRAPIVCTRRRSGA